MFYKMKNLLVFCMTFFSCLVLSNLASAQTSNYVKASIGVGDVVTRGSLNSTEDAEGLSLSLDSEIAQPISLTYGHRFSTGTALEVEVSSRQLDADGIVGEVWTSKLLNLGVLMIQEYNLSENFKPYIGAGFGVGQIGIKIDDSGLNVDEDEMSLTVLANAGLNYYISSSFSVGADLKYISNITEPEVELPLGGGSGDFRMAYQQFSYGLSAAYHF